MEAKETRGEENNINKIILTIPEEQLGDESTLHIRAIINRHITAFNRRLSLTLPVSLQITTISAAENSQQKLLCVKNQTEQKRKDREK
jgi:hypothetical protein